ncbi:MAG: hypothetical protein MUE44_34740 [Oscillatoriaceae cyanobacterium Prado104]|jgi:hypothetical protein|nr:hypothetical protein [Oscillatoriaceae cyanobacterium Prado104]
MNAIKLVLVLSLSIVPYFSFVSATLAAETDHAKDDHEAEKKDFTRR